MAVRNVVHLVASILMWFVFGYYWWVVIRRQITVSSLNAVGLLAAISLAGLAVTIAWVAHNKRLASRNRRRGAPAAPVEALTGDSLGRTVAAPDLVELRAARRIAISADDRSKTYSVEQEGG